MNKHAYILYIPGLGDHNPKFQRLAIRTWKLWKVEAELFHMDWANTEDWRSKFSRLLARIDELAAQDMVIGLVGASAGAAAAINAFAARPKIIAGVVCLAGKVNRPETIHPARIYRNPALLTAVTSSQAAVQNFSQSELSRILSRYALFDELVSQADSFIPGAHNRRLPSVGHALTIASQITLGAPSFINFLKQHQANSL